MKYLSKILFLALVLSAGVTKAQVKSSEKQPLKVIFLNKDVSTHVVSPELIQNADISTNRVEGDMPIKNILRIKPVADSVGGDLGILTIIGQKYIAQYKMVYSTDVDRADKEISVLPEDMKSIEHPDFKLSNQDLYKFSMQVLKREPTYHNVRAAAYGMTAELNNIYTVGDYFFLDVTFSNKTNIQYDIDQLRYKIEDKKIVKATNNQSVEIKPIFQLYDTKYFKKRSRNILVFNKFTFPGDKTFTIELAEKQISGRVLYLNIDYTDILNADSL